MSEELASAPQPSPGQRLSAMASIGLALVVVWAGVVTWIGHADPARTMLACLLGTLVGLALGILGPGIVTSLTGLIGPVARVAMLAAVIALLALTIYGAVTDTASIARTISMAAATIMVACWIPLSKLSGR